MNALLHRLCAVCGSAVTAFCLGFLLCCVTITLWDLAGLAHQPGVTVGWMVCGLTLLAGVFVGCQTDCA